MEKYTDKEIYTAVKGWSSKVDPGFYTFGEITSGIGMRHSKSLSHAIGRAADRLLFARHATGSGPGIMVASASQATPQDADLRAALDVQVERIELLAEQVATLRDELEQAKQEMADSNASAKSGANALTPMLKNMHDIFRDKWRGVMSMEQILDAAGLPKNGEGPKRIQSLLMAGEGWLCRHIPKDDEPDLWQFL